MSFWSNYSEPDNNALWYLEVEGFPYCCGIDVICGFPDGLSVPTSSERNNIEKYLRKVIKNSKKRGMLHLTLNHYQNQHFGMLVKSCGFKMKHSFYNPNSHNRCHFYTLAINQPKGVKKKVKRKF